MSRQAPSRRAGSYGAHPAALGKAFNGASTGDLAFSPLWVALIARLGFPAAAGLVAATL